MPDFDLISGLAKDASIGTDGATPPAITGTGVRGWLRAIYERLVAGIGVTSLPAGLSTSALQGTGNTSLASIDTKTPALVAGAVPVAVQNTQVNPIKSLTTAAIGDTALHAPAAGKSVRLYWYHIAANPSNGAPVVAALRFGANALFNVVPLSQYGGSAAHQIRAGRGYVQGAPDEVLYANLSAAQTTYFNVETEEV